MGKVETVVPEQGREGHKELEEPLGYDSNDDYLHNSNFNLSTPRSLDACRQLGILPKDLRKKTLISFAQPKLTKKLQKRAWQIHEQNRARLLKAAVSRRVKIIREERELRQRERGQRELLEKEKHKLAQEKRRIQRDLEKMIMHEVKTSKARELFNDKVQSDNDKEKERHQEVQRRAEIKMEIKMEKKNQGSLNNRRLRMNDEERAIQKLREIQQKQEMATKERQNRMSKRKPPQRNLSQKLQDRKRELQRIEEMKRKLQIEKDKKEKDRLKFIEYIRVNKLAEVARLRKNRDMRVKAVMQNQEKMRNKQLRNSALKEKERRKRLQDLDEARKRDAQEARKRQIGQDRQQREVKRRAEEIVRKKKESVLAKQRKVEEKMRLKELEHQKKMKEKAQQDKRKEQHRIAAYEKKKFMQEMKQREIERKRKHFDQRFEKSRLKQQEKLQEKVFEAQLMAKERALQVERQRRKEEYERKRLTLKIAGDRKRVEQLEKEQQKVQNMRAQTQKLAREQREKIQAALQLINVNELDSYNKENLVNLGIEKEVAVSILKAVKNIKRSSGHKDGRKDVNWRDMYRDCRRRKAEEVAEAALLVEECKEPAQSPPSENNSPQHRNTKSRSSLRSAAIRSIYGSNLDKKASARQKRHQVSSGHVFDDLEKLKVKHNKKVINLLEEEHERELKREARLAGVEGISEKEELRKTFHIERKEALDEIERVKEQQAIEIKECMGKMR